MTVGERIRAVRKYYKCSQRDFAMMLNLSQAHVSNIEANKDKPSDKIIKQICTIYKINMDWLKSGDGDMLIAPSSNSIEIDKVLIELETNLKVWEDTETAWYCKNAATDFTSILSLYRPSSNLNLDYTSQILYYKTISDIISKLMQFVKDDIFIKKTMTKEDEYNILVHQKKMGEQIMILLNKLSDIMYAVHGIDKDINNDSKNE